MFLSAHQPVYLPWLGLLHKISVVDLFIVYDDVEYSHQGWYNRNYILSKNGSILLIVPVIRNFSEQLLHNQVKIDYSRNWHKKHISSLEQCYSKSPYFKKYINFFIEILNRKYEYLFQLNNSILKLLLELFDINTTIKYSSEFNLKNKKSDRILDLTIKTNATHFLFGQEGSNYADEKKFKDNNVKIFFQKYNHPVYSQFNSNVFVDKLSSLDLLFNHGKESRNILLSNNLKKNYLKL